MFYLVSQNRIENRAARTIMAVFILAMMAMSCVSYPRQQHDNATLTQRMNKLRAAPLVIIHCHNPETTNDFRCVVSNSVGLIRLQHALPEWYMVRSRPLRNKYKPDEKQLLASIAYANKDLARRDNGMYITVFQ